MHTVRLEVIPVTAAPTGKFMIGDHVAMNIYNKFMIIIELLPKHCSYKMAIIIIIILCY